MRVAVWKRKPPVGSCRSGSQASRICQQQLGAGRYQFRELIGHADSGGRCANEVLGHMLRYWGEALVSFIHAYDPERILIGGGMMNAPERVLASLRKTVSDFAWAEDGQVELVQAEFPNNAD